jgi:hypothetical protein
MVAIVIAGCHRCPLRNWLQVGVGVNFCFHIVWASPFKVVVHSATQYSVHKHLHPWMRSLFLHVACTFNSEIHLITGVGLHVSRGRFSFSYVNSRMFPSLNSFLTCPSIRNLILAIYVLVMLRYIVFVMLFLLCLLCRVNLFVMLLLLCLLCYFMLCLLCCLMLYLLCCVMLCFYAAFCCVCYAALCCVCRQICWGYLSFDFQNKCCVDVSFVGFIVTG